MNLEDCERILEFLVIDVGDIGYDILNGFGCLNIGGVLEILIELNYKVEYFGMNGLFNFLYIIIEDVINI